MGKLDILTSKGQDTRIQELEAVAIWRQHYPEIEYRETPKDKPVAWDALLVKNGRVRGVAEMKCRTVTAGDFFRTFKGEWLITLDKVMDCIARASQLNVPFVGFLYLVPSKTLLFQTLWRPEDDGIAVPYRVEQTETQATVNGGKAVRMNAYIDMSNAKLLRGRG